MVIVLTSLGRDPSCTCWGAQVHGVCICMLQLAVPAISLLARNARKQSISWLDKHQTDSPHAFAPQIVQSLCLSVSSYATMHCLVIAWARSMMVSGTYQPGALCACVMLVVMACMDGHLPVHYLIVHAIRAGALMACMYGCTRGCITVQA